MLQAYLSHSIPIRFLLPLRSSHSTPPKDVIAVECASISAISTLLEAQPIGDKETEVEVRE